MLGSQTSASFDPQGGITLDLSPLHYMRTWSTPEEETSPLLQLLLGFCLDEVEMCYSFCHSAAAASGRIIMEKYTRLCKTKCLHTVC